MAEEVEGLEKPVFKNARYANPPSFTGWKGFLNLFDSYKFITAKKPRLPNTEVLNETLPINKPIFNANENSGMSCTWLGHSTLVVRMDKVFFITDPVWSGRLSPLLKIFGPRRYRPPPCPIDNLPELNFGLISHNHYDHLDSSSVSTLSKQFKKMIWYVPLGLKQWMIGCGINESNVVELNWGEHMVFKSDGKSYEIWCLPAQHWSQRTPFDRCKTLWSSWAVIGPSKKFFFAGDTGYCNEFSKIGKRFGPFDLAALPIGCYEPREYINQYHVDPIQAVQIHEDIRSRKSIGIHWGTYLMGSVEDYLDPPKLLKERLEKAGLNGQDFIVLQHGQTYIEERNNSKTN